MATRLPEEHLANAARRHHDDAVHLHDDNRLPNADHHYGFAVECALKSLLVRYLGAEVPPRVPGKPLGRPRIPVQNSKPVYFGHLPGLWSDVAMQLHGRTGSALAGLLHNSQPFQSWNVDDRYLDGSSVDTTAIADRRTAAHRVLLLHQQALIAGVLA